MMRFELLISLLLVTMSYSCGDSDHDEKPGGSHTYTDTRPSRMGYTPVWDPNGYVFFCLCMGLYVLQFVSLYASVLTSSEVVSDFHFNRFI